MFCYKKVVNVAINSIMESGNYYMEIIYTHTAAWNYFHKTCSILWEAAHICLLLI